MTYLTVEQWHEHSTGIWHQPGELADLSHIPDLGDLILARTVQVAPDLAPIPEPLIPDFMTADEPSEETYQ